jgi:hypothetical protein
LYNELSAPHRVAAGNAGFADSAYADGRPRTRA